MDLMSIGCFGWDFEGFLMNYDSYDKEGKKVGIRVEEEDELLWAWLRQGVSPPTDLDYPSRTNQIADPITYTLHGTTFHPPYHPRSTPATALLYPTISFSSGSISQGIKILRSVSATPRLTAVTLSSHQESSSVHIEARTV